MIIGHVSPLIPKTDSVLQTEKKVIIIPESHHMSSIGCKANKVQQTTFHSFPPKMMFFDSAWTSTINTTPLGVEA